MHRARGGILLGVAFLLMLFEWGTGGAAAPALLIGAAMGLLGWLTYWRMLQRQAVGWRVVRYPLMALDAFGPSVLGWLVQRGALQVGRLQDLPHGAPRGLSGGSPACRQQMNAG